MLDTTQLLNIRPALLLLASVLYRPPACCQAGIRTSAAHCDTSCHSSRLQPSVPEHGCAGRHARRRQAVRKTGRQAGRQGNKQESRDACQQTSRQSRRLQSIQPTRHPGKRALKPSMQDTTQGHSSSRNAPKQQAAAACSPSILRSSEPTQLRKPPLGQTQVTAVNTRSITCSRHVSKQLKQARVLKKWQGSSEIMKNSSGLRRGQSASP